MLRANSLVAKIARKPQLSTDMRAPSIHLEDDEVLMLVDSGATIHASWIEKLFPAYKDKIVESTAQRRGETATTAGGQALKCEGRCTLNLEAHGMNIAVNTNNMRVDIPILSVRRLVKDGYSVAFEEDGGYICQRGTNNTVR